MNHKIIELTKKFIAIPSDSNNRSACLHILEEAKKELEGFSFTSFVKDDIPSLLYTNTSNPTKSCKILFNVHLDVVPGSKKQFIPLEKDGKLYGSGAYDMKAAGATMILLFKEIAHKIPYTLGLQLVTDEEVIGYKGVNHQISEGVSAEFVISGECGSNLRIVNQLRGLYVVKLLASGVAAHAAYPWLGSNALLKLHKTIGEIMNQYPVPQAPSWQPTINIAKIETSNITHNKVPHDASAYLDIRYIQEDTDIVLKKIQSLLPDEITMEIIKTMPAHHTKKTNPFLQRLVHASREITHKDPQIAQSYAGSDIIFFSMKNIDSIEFGPVGDGQHSDEEWVDIQSLEDYYRILKHFLLSIK